MAEQNNSTKSAPIPNIERQALVLRSNEGISEASKPGLPPEIQALTPEEIKQVEVVLKHIAEAYTNEIERKNQTDKLLLDVSKEAKEPDSTMRDIGWVLKIYTDGAINKSNEAEKVKVQELKVQEEKIEVQEEKIEAQDIEIKAQDKETTQIQVQKENKEGIHNLPELLKSTDKLIKEAFRGKGPEEIIGPEYKIALDKAKNERAKVILDPNGEIAAKARREGKEPREVTFDDLSPEQQQIANEQAEGIALRQFSSALISKAPDAYKEKLTAQFEKLNKVVSTYAPDFLPVGWTDPKLGVKEYETMKSVPGLSGRFVK